MSKEAHCEELLKQLESVQSDSSITKVLNTRLPNCGETRNYDEWVDSSLRFLEKNENLFVNDTRQ